MTKVKVGPKGKHIIIPDGWEQVKTGPVKRGDRYADLRYYTFVDVEEEDLTVSHEGVAMTAKDFDCLIRQSINIIKTNKQG